MIDTFTVDGVSLATYGVYWDGSQLFDKPRKDVVFYSVPGRSGDLFRNNDRFENISINVNCYIKSNFRQNFDQLMNFLYSREGYVKLTNSKDPNVYRMGQFVDAVKPSTGQYLRNGKFTLVFSCMPQRFYESTTQMSFTSYHDSSSPPKLYGVFTADSSMVQSIMRSVPEEFRSNAQAFYAFNPPTDFGTGGQTATNVSMSWSESEVPFYVYWDYDWQAYYYAMGNVSGVSFAVPTIPSDNVPPTGYILTPMQLDGSMSISGTYNNRNFSFQSVDFSTSTSSMTESSALGADLSLTAEIGWYGSGMNSSTIMLSGYNGTDEKGRLYIQSRNASEDINSKLAEYVSTRNYTNFINIKIDLSTMDVYAYKTGLPDLNLNSCFAITGNIGKNYNTVKGFFHSEILNSLNCTVTARWWKI